ELRLESEQAGYSLGRWIAEVAGQQGGQAEGADEADEADGAEDRQARADDATVSGDDPGRVAAIVSLAAGVGRPLSAPVGWGLACASVGLPPRDAVTAYLWSFAENQAAVLLKAMPLGQAGAQRLLLR